MQHDSLILYSKIEALFFQVYPTFKNYPKAEKHGLCLQIKETFIELLGNVAIAKEVPSLRVKSSQQAAALIHNLVTLYRLSRSQGYISRGFFEQIDLKITEIKRILVGFMKSSRKPRHEP
jgi:hypothetical protein